MFSNEKDLDKAGERGDTSIERRHTFIVLDWDDTLLPTTWLTQQGFSLDTFFLPSSVRLRLEALDGKVAALLRKMAVLHGKVLIVTNAQPQWVQLSSAKFLPETHSLLFPPDHDADSVYSFSSSSGFLNLPSPSSKDNNNDADADEEAEVAEIGVFSSRFLFERDFPGNPSAWKQMAFRELLETRIDSKFLSRVSAVKSLSEGNAADLRATEAECQEQQKRGLKRSLSDLSICTADISGLVEVEGSANEVETEFKENDSFFSLSFSLPSVGGNEAASASNDLDLVEEKAFSCKKRKVSPEGNKAEVCNLISIGDCFHDCESLKHLDIGLDLTHCFRKTVKFVSYPSLDLLINEIEGLASCVDRIVNLKKEAHLLVSKKKVTA